MLANSVTSRRQLLKLGALAGATGGLALAGCSSTTGTPTTAKPTPLILLRVGAADATNSTGLDPRTASNGASLIVLGHVYDSLMALEDDAFRLRLAQSVEPNTDGTKWTVRIRDGVKFHNGQLVRAADVAYSLTALATKPSNRASVYADVDTANIKVIDPLTVEIPLKRPAGTSARRSWSSTRRSSQPAPRTSPKRSAPARTAWTAATPARSGWYP